MYYSESESSVYGIRLVRGDMFDDFDEVRLLREIWELKADVLRLKVNARQPDIISRISQIGLPYQLYNINHYNQVAIDSAHEKVGWGSDYSYVPFTESSPALIRYLVNASISEKKWVNYFSFFSGEFFTTEKELDASREFACSFDGNEDENRLGWILQYKGKPIGFFLGREESGYFNGILYGIIPEFMGQGHSGVIYQMMLHICHLKGLDYFQNEVGILNTPSQRSAESQGLKSVRVGLHLEFYPYLNLEFANNVKKSRGFKASDSTEAISQALRFVGEHQLKNSRIIQTWNWYRYDWEENLEYLAHFFEITRKEDRNFYQIRICPFNKPGQTTMICYILAESTGIE